MLGIRQIIAMYERQYVYVDKRRKIIKKGRKEKETRSEKAHDVSGGELYNYTYSISIADRRGNPVDY